jgi:hypothetical protein
MKNQWGRWSVWHGSDSAEYCEPPSDAASFPSLAEATEYAFAEHDRIKLVEGGIQQIAGHEQAVALAYQIQALAERLTCLTTTGSQWKDENDD